MNDILRYTTIKPNLIKKKAAYRLAPPTITVTNKEGLTTNYTRSACIFSKYRLNFV